MREREARYREMGWRKGGEKPASRTWRLTSSGRGQSGRSEAGFQFLAETVGWNLCHKDLKPWDNKTFGKEVVLGPVGLDPTATGGGDVPAALAPPPGGG